MTVAHCTTGTRTDGNFRIAGVRVEGIRGISTRDPGNAPRGIAANVLTFPRRASARRPAPLPVDPVDLVKEAGFFERLHAALGLPGPAPVAQPPRPSLRLVRASAA